MSNMDCPVSYTLEKVGGKWKMIIIWHLHTAGVMRYGELKKSLEGITHKMLSQQLKELVEDDLVHRQEYPQIPPKVEYSLTDMGQSLIPVLNEMSSWAQMHHRSQADATSYV